MLAQVRITKQAIDSIDPHGTDRFHDSLRIGH